MNIKSIIIRSLLALVLVVTGAVGWTSFKLWRSWQDVERVTFAPGEAREVLALNPPVAGDVPPEGQGEAPPSTNPAPEQLGDDVYDAFLIVGNETQQGGSRADVILLALLPKNGADPAIVSIPRDLYIENPCTEQFSRVNATLSGCKRGDIPGPDLLAVTVENFTGIGIDHFALFDFRGFEQVIDRVGGIDICVDHPTRDTNEGLADWELPAGCTRADGETALGWVRSRHTIQLVDGQWRTMPGVSDLTRNKRQQDVLLQMLAKARAFNSLGRLTATIESLTDTFTIDDELSLRDAANLAWDARAIHPDRIHRLEIPVENHTTSAGAQVLLPSASFTSVLAGAYPDLVAAAGEPTTDLAN